MGTSDAFSRQLLIAIDENPASHSALTYCGNLYRQNPGTGFHLVHCIKPSRQSVLSAPVHASDTLIPEDQVLDPSRNGKPQRLLEKCLAILVNIGVPTNHVRTSLLTASNQVYQSIVMEADRTMADAIVIARRGIGYFGEMVLGSVSASLVRSSPKTPLWVIDGKVEEPNILIGVDGSVHSLRAAEHVAHMIGSLGSRKIYLYHCASFLAPDVVCTLDSFYMQWERNWCDTHLAGDGCLFNGPRQLLLEAGVDLSDIVVLPVTKNLEESTSIITQAKTNRCGTIVVGSRGPSVAKGFFGGVSNRTIRQTQNMAVWIVS